MSVRDTKERGERPLVGAIVWVFRMGESRRIALSALRITTGTMKEG